jgi:hypothetical protein
LEVQNPEMIERIISPSYSKLNKKRILASPIPFMFEALKLAVRLVAMGARREARRALYRPARGDRQARGRERATTLTPGESGRYRPALARVGARVWARGRREGGDALTGRE